MLVLHGFWSASNGLCLWAEDSTLTVTSPSDALRAARSHPFAANADAIAPIHAGKRDTAVPDAQVGDQIMAAVVLKDAEGLTPAELEAFLSEQEDLSPKGWPRFVRINAALPQTPPTRSSSGSSSRLALPQAGERCGNGAAANARMPSPP